MMTGLRYAALFEAMTLLVLFCVAVPLKYWANFPQVVSVMGPVHGLAFMIFLWIVIRSWSEGIINVGGALRLFIGALVPGGGFVNERWLRQQSEDT